MRRMKATSYSAEHNHHGPVAKPLRQAADQTGHLGPHASFLAMQSVVGNRVFRELLASALTLEAPSLNPPPVFARPAAETNQQRSKTLNQMANPSGNSKLQRKRAGAGSPGPTGECEECGTKQLPRNSVDESVSTDVPPLVHEVLGATGRPLEPAIRKFFESGFGHDLSHVRVHTGEKAAESAHAVQAQAYTVGRDVVFGANKFAPATYQGRELLAHELAHTIQQQNASGSVLPAEQDGILEASAVAAGRDISNGRVVRETFPPVVGKFSVIQTEILAGKIVCGLPAIAADSWPTESRSTASSRGKLGRRSTRS